MRPGRSCGLRIDKDRKRPICAALRTPMPDQYEIEVRPSPIEARSRRALQRRRVVCDVFADETGDEIVAVVVAGA